MDRNEINQKNLLVAGFDFSHHSTSSGYHHLASFLPCDYFDANELPFKRSKTGSISRRINLGLFETLIKQKSNKYKIVHYLYPEDHILFSVPKKKNGISVATVHLSTDKFLDKKSGNPIKNFLFKLQRQTFMNLDGIITLSSAHERELRTILPQNIKVKFIPHGINKLPTNGILPNRNGKIKVVVIGSNYRDIDQFFDIVSYSQRLDKKYEYNLVGVSTEWKERAMNFNNVIAHPYLSEDEYFNLIQSSHVHLLPVSFATANNALLEAHALGVPSVTSNVPGIDDYALSTTKTFSNAEEAISIIDNFEAMEEEAYRKIRTKTLSESRRFHWLNISNEVIDFYQELIENKS